MPEATTDKNPLQQASEAVKFMALNEIHLVQAELKRSADLPPNDEVTLRMDYGFKANHAYHKEDNALAVLIQYFAKGLYSEDSSDTATGPDVELFIVDATFAVHYDTKPGEVIPEENLEAFAQLNGVYNSWPYWREYLQDCTMRMGIPPATMPLITAQKIVAKLAEKSESPSSDE